MDTSQPKLISNKSLYPTTDYLPNLEKNLSARGVDPDLPILSIPAINNFLWGFQRRKFYIIAARPSIGKSAFSLQLAYDQACQGRRVLVLSLEMTVEDMLERLFCHATQVSNTEILRGGFRNHKDKYKDFCKKLAEIPLVISDCIGKDFEEVDQILERMTVKPDFVLIDHLNAINSSGFNTKADIDQYVNNLNTLAKKCNLTMVLCCQINRVGQDDKDKTPKLHDLKGSGNLEEAADIVMLLHWPFKYKTAKDTKIRRSDFQVIIGKNRNGPTGFINLNISPETYTYTDARAPEAAASEPKNAVKEQDINWHDQ